jgi:hypothetical protein
MQHVFNSIKNAAMFKRMGKWVVDKNEVKVK